MSLIGSFLYSTTCWIVNVFEGCLTSCESLSLLNFEGKPHLGTIATEPALAFLHSAQTERQVVICPLQPCGFFLPENLAKTQYQLDMLSVLANTPISHQHTTQMYYYMEAPSVKGFQPLPHHQRGARTITLW